MSEKWKSQPKKFCEICKCWFADNKVSIQHHESGLRHKGAVQAKLRELSKQGSQRDREQRETNSILRQMESGALASFKRDVRTAPAVADRYNIHQNFASIPIKGASNARTAPPYQQQPGSSNSDMSGAPQWAEAFSHDHGKVYYWNIATGETTWTKPHGAVVPLEEQPHDEPEQPPPDAEQKGLDGETDSKPQPPTFDAANRVSSTRDSADDEQSRKRKTAKRRRSPVKVESDNDEDQSDDRCTEYSLTSGFDSQPIPIAPVSTSGGVKTEYDGVNQPDATTPASLRNDFEEDGRLRKEQREKEEREQMRQELEKHHRQKTMRQMANPYGEWSNVQEEKQEELPKLDLPPEADANQDYSEYVAVHVDPNEPKMNFKEKTLSATLAKKGRKLGTGEGTFKKRSAAGRSLRKKECGENQDE